MVKCDLTSIFMLISLCMQLVLYLLILVINIRFLRMKHSKALDVEGIKTYKKYLIISLIAFLLSKTALAIILQIIVDYMGAFFSSGTFSFIVDILPLLIVCIIQQFGLNKAKGTKIDH